MLVPLTISHAFATAYIVDRLFTTVDIVFIVNHLPNPVVSTLQSLLLLVYVLITYTQFFYEQKYI